MIRTRNAVALAILAFAVLTVGGCQVDFIGGNQFACEGENIQSTCLSGYLCNLGRCVPESQYVAPDTGNGGSKDVVEVVEDVPDIVVEDIAEDVPDIPPCPEPGASCVTDDDCSPQCSSLVCVEGVCCQDACENECAACDVAGHEGQCWPLPSGETCQGDGGDAACNACNGEGQCLPLAGEQCGSCEECAVPDGANNALCAPVEPGTDPFGDCGDNPLCGGACGANAECDLAAATPQDGDRCDTCRECDRGFCIPRLPDTPDPDCGDESCGGVCAEGGECTTTFLAPETKCETCHQCDGSGNCLPVGEGSPDNDCIDENPCGMTGLCAAGGSCAITPAGTECADPTCEGTTRTTSACNDSQECVSAEESCVPYTCDGQAAECRTECHANAPCADGFYCAGRICQGTGAPGDPCVDSVQCASGFCVDGVCCDGACSGTCEVCDGIDGVADPGTCAVPVGTNPLLDREGPDDGERDCDGQVGACDGVCGEDADGAGICDFGGTAEDSCGSCKWCDPDATGDCVNRPSDPPYYDDCQGDEICGGACEAGACVFAMPVDAPCGDGPCQVCGADRTCGLAAVGADPKGQCAGDAECGGGCNASGECGTFFDDETLCGEGDAKCFWCQTGNCVLIPRDETPLGLCEGEDELCRAKCQPTGQCGPPVPSGAPCDRVCHRCDGNGSCAFAFPDPLTEPTGECPGDLACGAHCDADTGACGPPRTEETVCVVGTLEDGPSAGDGCSICQTIPGQDGMRCAARADTPPGACVRADGDTACNGSCGSFGVCEWPGQEQPCGECHRCDGDGYCQASSDPLVSAEDCTPDDPLCSGLCLDGACSYTNSDQSTCGSEGTVCRWCQEGVCELIANGEDPLGQCNPVDHPICGETCDGAGQCAPAPGPDDAEGPIECGDACHWCDSGACAPIGLTAETTVADPFGRCEADQVCSAGECSLCGNGTLEAGEVCDPNDPEHPCEGVCTSADPCKRAIAFDCACTEVPIVEPDDGSDGCCPPIEERGLDPDCVAWPPISLNPDPFQPFTFTHIPAVDPATGTLYVGGRDDTSPTPRPRIFAISPGGNILWDVSTASNEAFASVATSSPVLVDGRLYFGRSTWLVAVDVDTRTTTEVVNLGALVKEPPVVARNGLLIVGTQDGQIRGVDPFNGTVEWTYGTGAGTLTGPGTQSGYYVYWGAGATLHVLDVLAPPTTTGSSPCFSPPTNLAGGGVGLGSRIGDQSAGSLYLADDAGTIYVLFAAGTAGVGCTPLNTDDTTIGGHVDATPVTLSDGSVIFGGHDPNLNPNPDVGVYAFTSNLTEIEWTAALGSHARFTPVIGRGPDGELVYVALRQSTGVRVLAIQPGLGGATQGLVWGHDYTVTGAPDAYITGPLAMGTGGTLYFRTSDGSLNAIVTGSSDGLSNRGWPKQYGDYGNTGNAP